MGHGTDQQPQQPTPVADDAAATPAQLLASSADDYAAGWGRHDAHDPANTPTGERQA